MDLRRNLVGILFCLVWGLSGGDVGWPLLNMDLLDEDIRKEVDRALQVVNQDGFQGWRPELIKQVRRRRFMGVSDFAYLGYLEHEVSLGLCRDYSSTRGSKGRQCYKWVMVGQYVVQILHAGYTLSINDIGFWKRRHGQ